MSHSVYTTSYLLGGKLARKMTIHLHLMLRLWKCGANLHSPHMPSEHAEGHLTLYLNTCIQSYKIPVSVFIILVTVILNN